MTSLPLVSVIVPAFNHGPFIRPLLESVAAETYPSIELVIVDDGSTDDTALKIAAWIAQNAQRITGGVQYRSRPNRGISATLTEMLEMANGAYVAPVASDDVLVPGGIERRVTELLATGAEAAFGDCRVIDEHGRTVLASGLFQLYRANRSRLHRRVATEMITNFSVPGPVLLVRRDTLREIEAYAAGLSVEDWYVYLKLASRGKLRFVDSVVAGYRLHESNVSRDPSRRREMVVNVLKTVRLCRSDYRGILRLLLEAQAVAAWVELRLPVLGVPAGKAIRGVSRLLSSTGGRG